MMPIVQLVILGYAFGGNVRHLKLAVIDRDHGVPAIRLKELAGALASNAETIETIEYSDEGQAITDLRNGRLHYCRRDRKYVARTYCWVENSSQLYCFEIYPGILFKYGTDCRSCGSRIQCHPRRTGYFFL